jgi:hypothetical protein
MNGLSIVATKSAGSIVTLYRWPLTKAAGLRSMAAADGEAVGAALGLGVALGPGVAASEGGLVADEEACGLVVPEGPHATPTTAVTPTHATARKTHGTWILFMSLLLGSA